MKKAHLSVQYASDLVIDDPRDVTTLAVFYDEIILPYRNIIHHDFSGPLPDIQAHFILNRVEQWEDTWRPLINAGVFRETRHYQRSVDPQRLEHHLSSSATGTALDKIHVATTLALSQETAPRFFNPSQQDTSTPRIAQSILNAFFEFRLPYFTGLAPEAILELRDELEDSKKGFRLYLNTLADSVEHRMRAGDSESDAAIKTLERELLPAFEEFRSQFGRDKFRRVIDVSAGTLKVAASPWSLEHWGEYAISLGRALKSDKISIRQVAFEYLATLESRLA